MTFPHHLRPPHWQLGLLVLAALSVPEVAAPVRAEEPMAPLPAPPAAEDNAATPTAPPRRCGLIPVCRRVPVTITKPQTEYRMECELVCEPGCCLAGCLQGRSDAACDRCRHATVRTKKRLVKKVTEEKVASHEYTICWVCPACAGLGGHCAASGRPPARHGPQPSCTACDSDSHPQQGRWPLFDWRLPAAPVAWPWRGE